MTGTLVLALVTLGVWREATTTWGPWAAQVTPGGQPVDVSPAAMPQRLHQQAIACLQDMSRQARAQVQSLDHGGDAGRLPAGTHVDSADRTGVGLPDARHQTCPGAGGRAAPAGATMHAGWDDTSGVLGHVALTPGHSPAPRSLAPVGA